MGAARGDGREVGFLGGWLRSTLNDRWTSSLARRSSERLRPSEREISRTSLAGSGSAAVGGSSAAAGDGVAG